MINVKYPRRGFVVEEIVEGCKTEGCSVKKLVVVPWEYYGEHDFNELTEGITVGQNTCDDDNEGECQKCEKPVYFNRHFIVTSDANAIKTPKDAFAYAHNVLKSPFPEGEALIATSSDWSFNYAHSVLKGRFLLGEALIATDAGSAACYARDILKTPWADGEAAIATSVQWSFNYAKYALQAPFPLGEDTIATSAEYSYNYAIYVLKAPFKLGEKAIATHEYYFKKYKELFPEPQVVEPAPAPEPIQPIEVRTGVILQEVTEGCSCEKYVVYEGCVAKEGDAWTDFTENLKVGEMSIVKDNTGECPKCGKDIKFKEYYIVTNIS